MRLLEGRVVGVTGGSSGIGRAIAVAAAEHGAKAVLVGDVVELPREGGEATVAIVRRLGALSEHIRLDVSKAEEAHGFAAAAERFGGIDVMVCNAGIALPNDTVDVPPGDFRRLMSVNLDGVFLTAQAAGQAMQRQGKAGSIVMIASMGAERASAVTVSYCASKGAVAMLAKAMADGFGPHGIRVNAVCPGIIETDLVKSSPAVAEAVAGMVARTPLRRMGQPSEIGNIVAWLGSDLSSFVTGVALLADGGLTAVI